MSDITNAYGVYKPAKNVVEQQIIERIHDNHIEKCKTQLTNGRSVTLRFSTISIDFSKLSSASQHYLLSKGCTKDRDVKTLLNVAETLAKIQSIFKKGLTVEPQYFYGDDSLWVDDNPPFQGYNIAYKESAESTVESADTSSSAEPPPRRYPERSSSIEPLVFNGRYFVSPEEFEASLEKKFRNQNRVT